ERRYNNYHLKKINPPAPIRSHNRDHIQVRARILSFDLKNHRVHRVTVSSNTSISTTTEASGFYSLPVTAGAYQLTATREPVYYTNSSVTAAVASGVVVCGISNCI
ncbi:MAG: hypothetical protein O8C58_01160, partial [Candidatus Methanoperedens sp.]|nr:hypothetical protein [Candidatus Methanoperedens sp.]